MHYIIGIVCIFLFVMWVPFRIVVLHPFKTVKYSAKDFYKYIKFKEYNNVKTGEIVAYVGLFGKGKTLSATHKVRKLYKKYNNKPVWDRGRKKFVTQKVEILSNVQLLDVPYTSFISLAQIFQAAEQNKFKDIENDTYTVTLVLGDEFSVQLNSRSFKDNINPLFLNTLLTCRHHHISLYYTAQRFGHVDALLRQVTSYVVDCDKKWRLMAQYQYDAWDMENATNALLLKPIGRGGFFVTDSDYNSYDTLAVVQNLKKKFDEGDMLSDEEILQLQNPAVIGMEAVTKPSRKYFKNRKKGR